MSTGTVESQASNLTTVQRSTAATTPSVNEVATVATASSIVSPVVQLAKVTPVPSAAPPAALAPAQTPLRIVSGLVSSVVGLVLSPFATNTPAVPAQPPVLWGLLAWARREFERTFAKSGNTPTVGTSPVATALAAAAVDPAPTPVVVSPSTSIIGWVTGENSINNTLTRFGISGADLGIMWDNGMVDNPNDPVDEHQILMAFGDTFGDPSAPNQDWRMNTLLRTSDNTPDDGLSIPDPVLANPNDPYYIFGGSPLAYQNFSKQIIASPGLAANQVTIIPTAGISVPTPGTPLGVTQYINFMSVEQWGQPGEWTTNYSAIANSTDNGETWTVDPSTVRQNGLFAMGNQNFQQQAYLEPGDGYAYAYGTPNGRTGQAYLSRVPQNEILDLTQYQYWNGSTWVQNDPMAAVPVIPPGASSGLIGALANIFGGAVYDSPLIPVLNSLFGGPGTVSEMSVQYNDYLQKYVVLYADQNNNVVMRTADAPQGPWSAPQILVTPTQVPGGLYAPMIYPWSGTSNLSAADQQYLYWNLSINSDYNVELMRTDLSTLAA